MQAFRPERAAGQFANPYPDRVEIQEQQPDPFLIGTIFATQ